MVTVLSPLSLTFSNFIFKKFPEDSDMQSTLEPLFCTHQLWGGHRPQAPVRGSISTEGSRYSSGLTAAGYTVGNWEVVAIMLLLLVALLVAGSYLP